MFSSFQFSCFRVVVVVVHTCIVIACLLLQDDEDVFDDYDHQMMVHGLGLEDKTTCDSLVAFHKDFKNIFGGTSAAKSS